MPSRRAVLGAVTASLTTVVAGCVGDVGGVDGTVTPSETAIGSSSRTDSPGDTTTSSDAGDCDAVEQNWVDPARESVEPKPLPEGPPAMDPDAVTDFVVAYEEAYLYNSVLRENTSKVGTWAQTPEVTRVAGGFLLSLRSGYYYNLRDVTTDDGTATEVHADGPETMKAYLVTEKRLVRVEGEYDEVPDPREAGTTVECWAES